MYKPSIFTFHPMYSAYAVLSNIKKNRNALCQQKIQGYMCACVFDCVYVRL